MSKSRNILPPKRFWKPWEEQFLRENYADALTVDLAKVLGVTIKRVLAKANALGLRKSVALIAETARERTLRPEHGARATAFKPGMAPWNKGTHYVAGGRSAETRFKTGLRPHTWVPVGSYRVVPDGALERKINDLPGPNTVRWKPVARLVWEAAHGPVPKGMVVTFKPGRKTTDPLLITLDAIELVNRVEMMRRNSYHTTLPPELQRVIQLRGVLTRQINKMTKEAA